MNRFIAARGLPTLLSLMGLAVILIISGASSVGFVFGLIVAGLAGVLLVSALLYQVAHLEDRPGPRERRTYRGPHAGGF